MLQCRVMFSQVLYSWVRGVRNLHLKMSCHGTPMFVRIMMQHMLKMKMKLCKEMELIVIIKQKI